MHVQDNEADAKKRAFTKAELHAFFEHCDDETRMLDAADFGRNPHGAEYEFGRLPRRARARSGSARPRRDHRPSAAVC
ncbi:hypothetical protein AB0K89_11505 [Streptomyces cinnamoneus]|uniref:hypothetical protein n=1 Tax=Streptomyces cinnamoneus TaxID=53446 RepID=UPI0034165BE7